MSDLRATLLSGPRGRKATGNFTWIYVEGFTLILLTMVNIREQPTCLAVAVNKRTRNPADTSIASSLRAGPGFPAPWQSHLCPPDSVLFTFHNRI